MARSNRHTRLPPPYLKRVWIDEEKVPDRTVYPFCLPMFREPGFELEFEEPVTIIVGENGTGKSTLLEGIAVLAGFEEGGGGRGIGAVGFDEFTEAGGGALASALKGSWLPKVGRGWFFRAETFFSLARYISGDFLSYSHGEGFMRFFEERCQRPGMFFFDEPESALSMSRQFDFLKLLRRMQRPDAGNHCDPLADPDGAARCSASQVGKIRLDASSARRHRPLPHDARIHPRSAWNRRDDDLGIDFLGSSSFGNYILDVVTNPAHGGWTERLHPMFDVFNPIFTDAEKAREHLESINWPEGPFCPHCGEVENVTRLQGKSHRAGLIQCNSCAKNFTVTVGTVIERSKIPLNKWLLATYLLSASKKGMSAHQLHRMLGVTYKTAWFMCHRIREAMKPADLPPMGGPNSYVEVDETFVGGKAKNRAFRKPAAKKAVVALVERDNLMTGKVRSFHVANVDSRTLRPLIVTNVTRDTYLLTDKASHYRRVGREFAVHGSTDHSAGQYVGTEDLENHTNTVENFFSIFKRGVIGTYHHMSEAHLHRYTAEFDFRYSTRKISDKDRADVALAGIVGKRLTYRRIDLQRA